MEAPGLAQCGENLGNTEKVEEFNREQVQLCNGSLLESKRLPFAPLAKTTAEILEVRGSGPMAAKLPPTRVRPIASNQRHCACHGNKETQWPSYTHITRNLKLGHCSKGVKYWEIFFTGEQ